VNLDLYYTFLCVAKHENYRKSANELYITPTAVFNRIKSLEAFVGDDLFVNHRGSICLTQTGKDFLPIVSHSIDVFEHGISEIKTAINNVKPASLYVSNYIGTYILPGFLSYIKSIGFEYPLNIQIVDIDANNYLKNNTPDIFITRENLDCNLKYTQKKICEGKIRLAVPNIEDNNGHDDENYFLKKYNVISNNHPEYWSSLKKEINNNFPNANFISVNSVSITAELISLNQGISYLPLYLSLHEDKKIRFISDSIITSPISFTYAYYKKYLPKINDFIFHLSEYLAIERLKY